METPVDAENIEMLLSKLSTAKSTVLSSQWPSYSEPEFARWLHELRLTLSSLDLAYERSLDSIIFSPAAISPLVTKKMWEDAFRDGLNQAVRLIDTAITQNKHRNEIGLDPIPQDQPIAKSKRVFIVHGRDNECKLAIAWFIEKLKFKAVILSEQGNGGLVVFEKLEVNADVDYAIILLTPDDGVMITSCG
jgi:hypothetical protein